MIAGGCEPLPLRNADRYDACSFATAADRLGSFQGLVEACRRIESEWPVPQEVEEYGTDENWWKLFQLSSESCGVVMFQGTEVVGFWESLAVHDNTYEAILRGENVNKIIAPDDVVTLLAPGTYKMYFVDLFLQKAHMNIVTRKLMVSSFLAFMTKMAEQGMFFDRIGANITGVEVKRQCQNLGFRKVTDHQVHRYHDRAGMEVPAEIFELLIGPDAKRLFSFDAELAQLYVKKGLYYPEPTIAELL